MCRSVPSPEKGGMFEDLHVDLDGGARSVVEAEVTLKKCDFFLFFSSLSFP